MTPALSGCAALSRGGRIAASEACCTALKVAEAARRTRPVSGAGPIFAGLKCQDVQSRLYREGC